MSDSLNPITDRERKIWMAAYEKGAKDALTRHYEGRTAVEGKPLELQSRDELLAYIHQHQAEQSQDAVERVATAIRDTRKRIVARSNECCVLEVTANDIEFAKAAITAIEVTSSVRAPALVLTPGLGAPNGESKGCEATGSAGLRSRGYSVNAGRDMGAGPAGKAASTGTNSSEISDNDRKIFENWREADCYPCELSYRFAKDSDGDYTYSETAVAWRAWQASKRYSEPLSVDRFTDIITDVAVMEDIGGMPDDQHMLITNTEEIAKAILIELGVKYVD